jgi:hypothetical protein
MISHLRNVDVKWLIEEYLVLFEILLTQLFVIRVYHQILNVAINLNHGHSSVIHEVDLADPFVRNLIPQFLVDLR